MNSNPSFLSIPPYVSTTWDNVRSLSWKQGMLHIALVDGALVEIPNLDMEQAKGLFQTHAEHLEGLRAGGTRATTTAQLPRNASPSAPSPAMPNPPANPNMDFGAIAGMNFPGLRPSGFNIGIDGVGGFQHDMALSDSPDLPQAILDKVSAVTRVMFPDSVKMMPKAEPHCNCPHCQIARAIHQEPAEPQATEPQPVVEEAVSDDELKFREWDIENIAENMYMVKNPLNLEESYRVFLGQPVGCTCGNPNCEHILAVLRS